VMETVTVEIKVEMLAPSAVILERVRPLVPVLRSTAQ
jgi:hypothetical protein